MSCTTYTTSLGITTIVHRFIKGRDKCCCGSSSKGSPTRLKVVVSGCERHHLISRRREAGGRLTRNSNHERRTSVSLAS